MDEDGRRGAFERVTADPGLTARFSAAYRGDEDPLDALLWAEHPGRPGPSGAPAPQAALERARAAVYGPGATDEDRALAMRLTEEAARRRSAVAQALDAASAPVRAPIAAPADPAEGSEGSGSGPRATSRRRRRRPVLVLGAVGAALAIVLAGVAALRAGTGAAGPRTPQVASTPIAFSGAAAQVRRDRADLQRLFDQDESHTIGLYLSQHRTALSVQLRTDSIAVDDRSTGSRTFSLRGIENGEPTGLMSVLLTCDRRAAYSWVLTAPGSRGRPVRVSASGGDCHGSVVLTTFVPKPGHVPTALHVTVPRGVRTIVEVDLSHY